ncbi:carboxypeptidase-like regulatory domain-containing protein [Draconibacterium sp. IB214405]|uniref:carboxypeptidase-like regulatory domain-containing protein n=1 Tax=Draconibacterium sp. IB214405 TaxID=3097352 RepID=UPI002A0D7690|nr:carboxypeptidase-like regulatory domain-containing protein [Draconibacterium sp. IB214405]MDX8341372.1 carboxypeptidase-like regulatory domain-containing protein [Draconibacterium sp. IB214405]
MKKTIIFIFTVCLALTTLAQNGSKVAHTIKGKVVDSESNRPVSYTNIGLEGTFFGTASDSEGNFELKIPEEMVDKAIYFSAVGFKNQQFPVKDLFSKEFAVIKLQPQSYGVGEVDIAAQNMVLIRILRMASENIKYNYGSGPFNMHFAYSNEKTVDGAVQSPQVAQVLLYDASGYTHPSKADAFKARNYSVTKEQNDDDYSFSTAQLNLDDLLEFDWARSASGVLNPALLNDYKLELESQPVIDGKEYWVITFSPKVPSLATTGDYYAGALKGKITVNKEDYSVLKIEGQVVAAKNNKQGRALGIGQSNTDFLTDLIYSFEVDYKDLLLKRVSLDKSYSYAGKKVSEQSALEMNRAHTNNLTVVDSRDYFPGE